MDSGHGWEPQDLTSSTGDEVKPCHDLQQAAEWCEAAEMSRNAPARVSHCIILKSLSMLVSCSQAIVGDGWTIDAFSAVMWVVKKELSHKVMPSI